VRIQNKKGYCCCSRARNDEEKVEVKRYSHDSQSADKDDREVPKTGLSSDSSLMQTTPMLQRTEI
jgi:hypothetical protein